jgi:transcriptional regulator with XRE-family HTH domain
MEMKMTLGEKLKSARKSVGLTQEQLADKLMVSRQAITKWESDKGMPDIENLKKLSKLLNVSIDYLVDDGEKIDLTVLREEINLVAEQILTKGEKAIDWGIGLTVASFGIPQMINDVKNADKEFYLVDDRDKQFLVTVTDEFIESRQLISKITEKKFCIGEFKFILGTVIP